MILDGNKLTGQVRKYGIGSGKITRKGKSYRANRQVNALNNKAGFDLYETKTLARNLTRTKARSMEQGLVNAYARNRQRLGLDSHGVLQDPIGNRMPQPQKKYAVP
ncbi:MAG: hypothetical protein EA424_28550 [Planctomycetaceae bacterium]|nr:MAG: hypothetical protein EA424_28550 [Planctomycetaceae bacterium]